MLNICTAGLSSAELACERCRYAVLSDVMLFVVEKRRRASLPVRPVQDPRAQVESQLRDLIIHGLVAAGEQLPTEAELSAQFGVARGTVREALGRLASEGLVVKRRGAKGGTFAAAPKPEEVVQALTGTISLMATSEELTIAELLEIREMLEIPAARLAAQRRTAANLEMLRAAVPLESADRQRRRNFTTNAGFHEQILAACGNRLLRLATEPVFITLQTRSLGQHVSTPEFWDRVTEEHSEILKAIEAGDCDAAERTMRQHLEFIRPNYEQVERGNETGEPTGAAPADAARSRAAAAAGPTP
jgi:GntR family transcriptional regulator, transcriptional repressor for pyruvate dehydrogenase complex